MTDLDDTTTGPHPDVTRRLVLRGASLGGLALPLLAACGGGDEAGGGSTASASASASSSAPASSAAPSASAGGGSGVPTADVPVGGGTILGDEQVVLTQPSEGTFKAFSAVCTHQGCTVGKVEEGQIVCPCHGSRFSIEDGSPLSGPAQGALSEKKITVQGDQITLG